MSRKVWDTDYTEFSYLGTDYTAEYTTDDHGALIEVTSVTYGDEQESDRESMHWPAILKAAEQSVDNDLQSKAERAAEQAFADYHGGSGPMSMQEQVNRAWQEKRDIRR